MDKRPNTRHVDRERRPPAPQPPRGAKRIVIPMTRPHYDDLWHQPDRLRTFLAGWAEAAPGLFPAGFDRGQRLHGFGRESRELPGVRRRKVVPDDGTPYRLRPGFVTASMTGTAEELADPRLLGDLATTVGGGCTPGVALTAAADDDHLRDAYGVFAAEARDVAPGYAPETVNADGRAATLNAFRAWFPAIAVVLCFLHGSLKVRDRCRKAHDLHRRAWDVDRAATAEEFRRLMGALQRWRGTRTWTAAVGEMLAKPWAKAGSYAAADDHPGCHRTSDAADRPMNRLCRLRGAGRGLHGHQGPSGWRSRGRAPLLNFRPYAPRGQNPRAFESPAHRLNGKRYHEHWLPDLMASTSLMGFRGQGVEGGVMSSSFDSAVASP